MTREGQEYAPRDLDVWWPGDAHRGAGGMWRPRHDGPESHAARMVRVQCTDVWGRGHGQRHQHESSTP